MATSGRRTPGTFLQKHSKAAAGAAVAGAVAPAVLLAILAGRAGRRRGLRFYRRWRRTVVTELDKWR